MSSSALKHGALARALMTSVPRSPMYGVILTVCGAILLTVSAKVQVPFWPVPMTLQSLAVLVLASAFGTRLGLLSVGLYLAAGAAGLPVMAYTPECGLGLSYMVGPTGGYLVGFALATALVGALADRGWDRSLYRAGVAMTLGGAVILLSGWAWLAWLIGPGQALEVGVLPFLPAEVIKITIAMALLPFAWTLERHWRAPIVDDNTSDS